MPNIPMTHNRPVNSQRPVRRGSKVTPSETSAETTGDRTQRTQSRTDRRRRQERRQKQVAVRFERRNKRFNRRHAAGLPRSQTADRENIGRYINTQV